jgi:hypothetical protein
MINSTYLPLPQSVHFVFPVFESVSLPGGHLVHLEQPSRLQKKSETVNVHPTFMKTDEN